MILVDGVRSEWLPATDSAVLRGDGCFEAVRSYEGRLFALDEHLERLGVSAKTLDLDPPPRDRLREWCQTIADELGDGVVRIVLSRGDAVPGSDEIPRCVVLGHRLPRSSAEFRLATVPAPWHAAGRKWELAGSKTISYAPNMSAGRVARKRGADDALLVSGDRVLLEGPTFSVGWVVGDRLETPSLDLLILDSITRRHVIRLARAAGVEVVESTFDIDRLDQATEVMAWSTVKEVTAVRAVDDRDYPAGPMTRRLSAMFDSYVDGAPDLT